MDKLILEAQFFGFVAESMAAEAHCTGVARG
jgi:hypothetical protein